MMLWIDGDACPVVDAIVRVGKAKGIPVSLVKNIHHVYDREDLEIHTVSDGPDSVDFYILNHSHKGDVVITQDTGLAALVMSKLGYAIHPNGRVFTEDNIDLLIDRRYTGQLMRRKHGIYPKNHKGKKQPDTVFEAALIELLDRLEAGIQNYK
jgi:uncharacterized protein YaiI (UPF0178 family)